MSIEKLYVVTMYRYADRESHSYVIGVFTERCLADLASENEKFCRGSNKYYPEIVEFEPNNMISKRVVLPLDEN
jgi:hypothetical protein